MFLKGYKFKGLTDKDYSFLDLKENEYEIPIGGNHPGSFGFKRRNHIHEGIDIYCKEGDIALAIEEGVVLDIGIFTGAEVESPWWNKTEYISILVNNYVYLYGEIVVNKKIKIHDTIRIGEELGTITPVLKEFKNKRPRNMLHFEIYEAKKYKGPGELTENNEYWLLNPIDIIKIKG